jgi:hypothetical protein
VFDASGREVRRLAAPGPLRWDLRDQSGARVPSGVYYIQHEPFRGARPGRVKLCVTATD